MHIEPKTISEVNENLIELKQSLIASRGLLSKTHNDYHTKGIEQPLSVIKEYELAIQQYTDLIDIAKLQKENIKRNGEIKGFTDKISSLKQEVFRLKEQIKHLKQK